MTHTLDKAKKEYESLKASDALRQRVTYSMKDTFTTVEGASKEASKEASKPIEETSTPIEVTTKTTAETSASTAETSATTEAPKNTSTMDFQTKRKRRHPFRIALTTAATALIALTIGLNASSDFAGAVASVPGLEGMVKVLTFGRYEVKDNGFEAKIETPRIEGLVDKKLESELNASFKTYSDEVIRAFEKDLDELKKDFPGQEVHYGVDSGYKVLTDTQDYFVIDLWQVNTAGSATEFHRFYTVDKWTQELVTLSGLFKDGAAFDQVLEAYVLKEMRRQMDSEEGMYWLDDKGMMPEKLITDKTLFYINAEGNLVIAFEEYSVAPGSSGTPEFIIPAEVIKDIRR